MERLLELSTPVSDSVIEGSIEGEDDEDWYVIEDLDTENIMFQIEYSVDECNIDFEVLSDIEVVGSALNFLSPDSVFCTVDGHCFVHVLSSQGTGDYTVTIQPSSFSDCEGPDEIEPNDYAHEYNVITSNVFEGYGCPGNFDWFMIEGLSGQDAQVTLYFDDRECRLSLSVCSDSEILDIISGTTSPAGGFYVIPGQCYIVVRSDWMEGAYRVEIDTVDEITE